MIHRSLIHIECTRAYFVHEMVLYDCTLLIFLYIGSLTMIVVCLLEKVLCFPWSRTHAVVQSINAYDFG